MIAGKLTVDGRETRRRSMARRDPLYLVVELPAGARFVQRGQPIGVLCVEQRRRRSTRRHARSAHTRSAYSPVATGSGERCANGGQFILIAGRRLMFRCPVQAVCDGAREAIEQAIREANGS